MKLTNQFVAALLQPIPEKGSDRKVWSLSIHGVVVPFFMATNVNGDTRITPDALGAPLRLAYEKDGTPKFSKNGRPILRVAKELSEQVRIIRENFAAGLIAHANAVAKARPDDYKAHAELCHKAGEAVYNQDRVAVEAYIASIKADATDGDKGEGETVPGEPEKELVAA